MKLYATITSERASKGQGGNKDITVELKDEDAKMVAALSFYITQGMDRPSLYVTNCIPSIARDLITSAKIILNNTEQKGKKQKDDDRCNNCGSKYPFWSHPLLSN